MDNTKRKRNKTITIRMTTDEYSDIQSKVKESGLTQQTYLISSAIGGTITSSDELAVLKEISKTFSNFVQQLQSLTTNVNQMTHIANNQGNLSAVNELIQISEQINQYRKECEELWLLIRLSINQQNHTVQ